MWSSLARNSVLTVPSPIVIMEVYRNIRRNEGSRHSFSGSQTRRHHNKPYSHEAESNDGQRKSPNTTPFHTVSTHRTRMAQSFSQRKQTKVRMERLHNSLAARCTAVIGAACMVAPAISRYEMCLSVEDTPCFPKRQLYFLRDG